MHSGSVVNAAKVFGMGRSSASRDIWQVIDVIITSRLPKFKKFLIMKIGEQCYRLRPNMR